jgi:hypothetical protein
VDERETRNEPASDTLFHVHAWRVVKSGGTPKTGKSRTMRGRRLFFALLLLFLFFFIFFDFVSLLGHSRDNGVLME